MRKDSHHIQIKNLRTKEEVGFMLTSGDKPFTVQGVDAIATRISEGEILYTDFTNSRVFAQSDWSGGISKYWQPERIYSVVYPTLKYADSQNAKVDVSGEFSIGAGATLIKDFPNPTTSFVSATNGEAIGVVYAGVKGTLKIWRSADHGITWSEYLDLSTDSRFTGCDEIIDIVFTNNNGSFLNSFSEKIGENLQQLWFIAYNNTAHTSVLGKKIIFADRVSCGLGNFNASSVNVSSMYGFGATATFDSTLDMSAYSVTFTTITTGLDFNIPRANNSWYIGQDLQVEGAVPDTWFNCEVKISDQFSSKITISWPQGAGIVGSNPNYKGSFDSGTNYVIGDIVVAGSSYYIAIANSIGRYPTSNPSYWSGTSIPSGGTTYTRRVRIKPNDQYRVYETTDSSVVFNARTPFLGWSFITGGNTYSIIGRVDISGNNATLIRTMGSPEKSSGTGKNLVRIYNHTGNASTLDNTGTITFNAYDYIFATTIFPDLKKFHLVQTSSGEELFGYTETDNRVSLIGQQTAGTGNVQYNNLYTNFNSSNGDPNQFIAYNANQLTLDIGYFAKSMASNISGVGFIGTQIGVDETGIQSKLYSFSVDMTHANNPTALAIATLGEQSISAMVFDYDQLWIGTDLEGRMYTYVNNNLNYITKLPTIHGELNNYIDSITSYGGKIVVGYQNGPGVYVMDPNTYDPQGGQRSPPVPVIVADILTTIVGKDPNINLRITKLLSTGVNLLIGTNDPQELYYYNRSNIADSCNITSSIYGGYISNVSKNWLYAYIRTTPWTSDDGQKVRMQVSFDEGQTWVWMPKKKFLPLEANPADFTDYEQTYQAGGSNDQWTFFFPTTSLTNTIMYRAWLYKGATYIPTCTHVAIHFMINYKQELLFNYNLVLAPNIETLDGRHIDKRTTQDKVRFLKEIWQNQDICEFTHVDGKKYIGISFSDDRTPGQGMVIQAQNANSALKDTENLAYNILFTLKTIANFSDNL